MLDLKQLSNKLDQLLENETEESLNEWLLKRNSMQQSIIPFETSKVKGLFVVLPEGATDFSVYPESLLYYYKPLGLYGSCDSGDLPPGNWQLLGLLNEVSEEQAEDIVEKILLHYWKDYESDYEFATIIGPVDSLHSLARSLNVPENSVVLIEKK